MYYVRRTEGVGKILQYPQYPKFVDKWKYIHKFCEQRGEKGSYINAKNS